MEHNFVDHPPKFEVERIEISERNSIFAQFFCAGRATFKPIKLTGFTQADVDAVWYASYDFSPPKSLFQKLNIFAKPKPPLPSPKKTIKIGDYTLYGVIPLKMLSSTIAECSIDYYTIG